MWAPGTNMMTEHRQVSADTTCAAAGVFGPRWLLLFLYNWLQAGDGGRARMYRALLRWRANQRLRGTRRRYTKNRKIKKNISKRTKIESRVGLGSLLPHRRVHLRLRLGSRTDHIAPYRRDRPWAVIAVSGSRAAVESRHRRCALG